MAEMYVSEDRKSVIVVDDLGDEEQLSIEEFISCYGYNPAEKTEAETRVSPADQEEPEEPIKAKKPRSPMQERIENIDAYWDTFIDLCHTVGDVHGRTAVATNAENGIYPVQVVVHDYYDHELTNVDRSIAGANVHYDITMRKFENICASLGFRDFGPRDKVRFRKFLEDDKRRRYVCGWAHRYQEAHILVSPRDIILQSYQQQNQAGS